MSQSFEVQGIIHSIGDTTEYGNNGFPKREYGIKLIGENENPTNPNHAALELIKDKCVVMDNHSIGEEIQVQFNLSGRLWSSGGKPEKCFTSLQAWRVTPVSGQSVSSSPADQGDSPPPFDDNKYDDIPF